jgi:hypothetical protein
MPKGVLRLLRRSILSDPHLWVAFAAAVVFLLLRVLHELQLIPWEVPSEGLLMVITFCIIMLVADRLKEGEDVRENAEKLRVIEHAVHDKRVALRGRPSTPEDYDYLWGGYSGKYYVYNPSYRVDRNTGEEEIVKILVHRYQNPSFEKARYLFLTKDASGNADLKTFRRLMAAVRKEYPAVVGKVEVRQLKDLEASSAAEMYLGTRHGRPMGVMELKEPALDPQHGMPHYYLVIDDKNVLDHYYKDHFEPAWNDANAEDVKDFWA